MANLSLSNGSVHLGIGIMSFSGFVMTATLVLGKVLKELQFPYWSLQTASAVLLTTVFSTLMRLTSASFPERAVAKWVFLRAGCSMGTFILGVAAVQVGASPGDVAALTSINIVGAAVLGRLFLNEQLGRPQCLAILLSVVGAVLITKPEFLFGRSEQQVAWLGYVLSLLSGFLRAGMYVCSRKCAKVSVSFVSLVVSVMSGLVFIPLAYMGGEQPVAAALEQPLEHAAVALLSACVALLAITSGIAGGALCPAAVAATVYTASNMVLGYIAQTLLFHSAPDTITLGGAAAMLVAVGLMTATRVAAPAAEPAASELGTASSAETSEREAVSDTDSLASFASVAAAEFVTAYASLNPETDSVRMRRPADASQPSAEMVGVVASA